MKARLDKIESDLIRQIEEMNRRISLSNDVRLLGNKLIEKNNQYLHKI